MEFYLLIIHPNNVHLNSFSASSEKNIKLFLT